MQRRRAPSAASPDMALSCKSVAKEVPTITNEALRITVDPKVLVGKPVIQGTRLSVEFVIGPMAEGWSEGDILDNYPEDHT